MERPYVLYLAHLLDGWEERALWTATRGSTRPCGSTASSSHSEAAPDAPYGTVAKDAATALDSCCLLPHNMMSSVAYT